MRYVAMPMNNAYDCKQAHRSDDLDFEGGRAQMEFAHSALQNMLGALNVNIPPLPTGTVDTLLSYRTPCQATHLQVNLSLGMLLTVSLP